MRPSESGQCMSEQPDVTISESLLQASWRRPAMESADSAPLFEEEAVEEDLPLTETPDMSSYGIENMVLPQENVEEDLPLTGTQDMSSFGIENMVLAQKNGEENMPYTEVSEESSYGKVGYWDTEDTSDMALAQGNATLGADATGKECSAKCSDFFVGRCFPHFLEYGPCRHELDKQIGGVGHFCKGEARCTDTKAMAAGRSGWKDEFKDLGTAGFCSLEQPKKLPDGVHLTILPAHIHFPPRDKNRCAGFCKFRSKPDSLGKGFRCFGYTITKQGACFIWKDGPVKLGPPDPKDPQRHCYAVASLLPKIKKGCPEEEKEKAEIQKKMQKEEKGEEDEVDITDLGLGGFCSLVKPNKILQGPHKGKMTVFPNHIHVGDRFFQKEGQKSYDKRPMTEKCKSFCQAKSKPDSLGKGMRCFGYTITKGGTCFIWRAGPLKLGPKFDGDPERHCYAVSSLLPVEGEEEEPKEKEEEKKEKADIEKKMEKEEDEEEGEKEGEDEEEEDEEEAEEEKVTDLGLASGCVLAKPRTKRSFGGPPGGSNPAFLPLPPPMKDKCKEFCLSKLKPNSLGPGMKCYGYTIQPNGACKVWREGPLKKGPRGNPKDKTSRCHAVASLLPKEVADEQFTNLGASSHCELQKPKIHPKTKEKRLLPRYIKLAPDMKDKCRDFCLEKSKPDSFGKGLKCWGYTIETEGQEEKCVIWQEGPLKKGSRWHPSNTCNAVTSLLPKSLLLEEREESKADVESSLLPESLLLEEGEKKIADRLLPGSILLEDGEGTQAGEEDSDMENTSRLHN